MVHQSTGYVAISIDLNFGNGRLDRATQYTITSRLAKILGKHQIPATWTLTDPAKSVVVDRIAGESSSHEIGILGDASWLTPHIERAQLLGEMMTRFGAARGIGLPATTLALSDVPLQRHLDLLVAHGVRVIRPTVAESFGKARPSRLQCGIWQVPGTMALPQTPASKALPATVHVVVDAVSISGSVKELRRFERLLKRIAKHRDGGMLQIETLAQAGERLTEQRPSGGSILRKAA